MTYINKLKSSGFVQNITKKANEVMTNAGKKIATKLESTPEKDSFIAKAIKAIEPTGGNNGFLPMASLMVGTVIVPRIIVASRRNPDNKEATRDEIQEILFRDIQTILIILFALKAMNSVVSGKATKLTGIPMVNKPFEKVFNSEAKGVQGIVEKGKEFIQNPAQKIKSVGKNILNALNPNGGVVALTDTEIISKYTDYGSSSKNVDEIIKLIDSMPSQGGDSTKVFNLIMDSIIKAQDELLNGKTGKNATEGLISAARKTANANGNNTSEMQTHIDNAKRIKRTFEGIREAGYENFKNTELDENSKNVLIDFFRNPQNALAKTAGKVVGILRTIAFAVEVTYLGFGLPALNQVRLEKKYLKSNPNFKGGINNNSSNVINESIKPHEIKVFQNFLK